MFKPWEAQFHAKFMNFYITNRHATRVNMQTVVCTHLSSPFRSKWHMYVPLNAILLFLLDGPLRFQLDHHIIDFKISSDIIQHKKPREKSLDCHKDLAFNLDVLSLTSSITIGLGVFTKKELKPFCANSLAGGCCDIETRTKVLHHCPWGSSRFNKCMDIKDLVIENAKNLLA